MKLEFNENRTKLGHETQLALFFRASASCSKILGNCKYCIFNTAKIFRAPFALRASASCSKILNNKKYTFNTVNSGHPLFFRASASCSKIMNVKVYSMQINISGQVLVAQKSWMIKNTLSIQWKVSGQLCFSGQAHSSCSKLLNVKHIFNPVKNSRANSVFQGKRRLLKTPK